MTDPSVWVQLRDNGRSLSARYWPIVAGERAGTALPTAARSDTGVHRIGDDSSFFDLSPTESCSKCCIPRIRGE